MAPTESELDKIIQKLNSVTDLFDPTSSNYLKVAEHDDLMKYLRQVSRLEFYDETNGTRHAEPFAHNLELIENEIERRSEELDSKPSGYVLGDEAIRFYGVDLDDCWDAAIGN